VATEFVRTAVAAKTDKPVRTIGVAVDATPSREYRKADFGLPSDRFTFLFSFDFASYPARKNPTAAIDAFRKAFPAGTEPVSLVLKSINGERRGEAMAMIKEQAAADTRIVLMDGFLTRDQVFGLESVADAYVSLHRSEGFGLGLAESMCLGKPVVGTAYSGNLDFMNAANSCLVGYQLIDVRAGEYPHHDGQVWAEPDIDQAAYFMARIAHDGRLRETLGQNAQATIRQQFGDASVGARIGASLQGSRPA
jgi:glycosyltransferase involved in cell wall biosynthesis